MKIEYVRKKRKDMMKVKGVFTKKFHQLKIE